MLLTRPKKPPESNEDECIAAPIRCCEPERGSWKQAGKASGL